jgi:hypothetical protein
MVNKYQLYLSQVNPSTYSRVVDPSFQQFQLPPPPLRDTISVEEFFTLYDQIFYDIPTEGLINSHEYIVKTSGKYIQTEVDNQDVQLLLDEITALRQELLESNQRILNMQLSSSLSSSMSSPIII